MKGRDLEGRATRRGSPSVPLQPQPTLKATLTLALPGDHGSHSGRAALMWGDDEIIADGSRSFDRASTEHRPSLGSVPKTPTLQRYNNQQAFILAFWSSQLNAFVYTENPAASCRRPCFAPCPLCAELSELPGLPRPRPPWPAPPLCAARPRCPICRVSGFTATATAGRVSNRWRMLPVCSVLVGYEDRR